MFFNKYLLNGSPECDVSILDTEVSAFSYNGKTMSFTHMDKELGTFPVSYIVKASYPTYGNRNETSFDIDVNLGHELSEMATRLLGIEQFNGARKLSENGNLTIYAIREANDEEINLVFDFVITKENGHKVVVEIKSEDISQLFPMQ